MRQLFDWGRDLLPVLLLGAFGGIARSIASRKRDEKISIWWLMQEIVLAIFAGIVIHLLLKDTSLWESVKTASVALAGYSSRSVLALLQAAFLQHAKKITKEKNE